MSDRISDTKEHRESTDDIPSRPGGEPENLAFELTEAGKRYFLWLPQRDTDYIQKHVVTQGRPYEIGMLEDMRSRLTAGDHVLDVGANIGNHAIYLAVTTGCRVTAFEPNAALVSLMRRSLALNALEGKVRIVEAGVGAEPGRARFSGARPENLGAQSLTLSEDPQDTIEIVALDDAEGVDDVRMLKIDVEGMESQVLEGALRLIARARPLIYVEALNEDQFLGIDRRLGALGYVYWDTFNKDATHLFIHNSELTASDRALQMHKHLTRTQYYRQAAMEGVIPRLHDLVERLDVAWSRFHQMADEVTRLRNVLEEREASLRTMREAAGKREAALSTARQSLAQAQAQFAGAKALLERAPTKAELARARAQIVSLETERSTLQRQLEDQKRELTTKEQAWTAAQAERQRHLAEADALGRELAQLMQRRDIEATTPRRWYTPLNALIRQVTERSQHRLAGQCMALAKERYAANAVARLLLASLASALDPRPFREKWYAFRLHESGLSQRADEVLTRLEKDVSFSPSEKRARREITRVLARRNEIGAEGSVERRAASREGSKSAGQKRRPRDMNVALICDEFTFLSFRDELNAIVLDPTDWQAQLERNDIDLFFCESAWSGVDTERRPWMGKIYASQKFHRENRETLMAILEACRRRSIPTVFWNKEDPGHFDDRVHDFVKTAQLFDFVFTTDAECVERYRAEHGCSRVGVLPFAAQPRLYNPVELTVRERKVVFTGSWYAYFAERCADMRLLFQAVIDSGLPLEIYDRYYGGSDENHFFPAEYHQFIRPNVPADRVAQVIKSGLFGLNVNSVKTSPTMFARRVFELMASNTLVVSNYSLGMEGMFGDQVLFADREPGRLRTLSAAEIDRMRDDALHTVLSQHTYKHRFEKILDTVGIPYLREAEDVTLVYRVATREEAVAAIRLAEPIGASLPGSRVLLLVSNEVPSSDVAPFYETFNRLGVGVLSEAYLLEHGEAGASMVDTAAFALLSPREALAPRVLGRALLHRQYLGDEIVQFNAARKYVYGPAADRLDLLGRPGRFLETIRALRQGAHEDVYHM